MKDFFGKWAAQHDVAIDEGWTVEQICDALVKANVEWPAEMTNEQGWQLWTATLRRDLGVRAVKWDELSPREGEDGSTLEITFTLAASRTFVQRLPRERIRNDEFGQLCTGLERDLREWNTADLAEREAKMALLAAEWEVRAPDLMDHVVGYRAWNLNGGQIKPIGAGDDVWKGGEEVRASCKNGGLHVSPDSECECGLYAWHDFERVKANANESQVFGAVQAWGRIEVHSDGFRSEFMRPCMLAYDDSDDQLVSTLDGETPEVRRGPDFDRVTRIADLLGGDIEVVGYSVIQERGRDYGLTLSAKDTPDLFPST
ncbi:MAG: hypothetical protein ABW167_00955 [Baekduia sp.]